MTQLMTAQGAWGAEMPDWIATLAQACIETSQNQVARRLGYSSTVVSLVLRNKYTGDIGNVETAVRGTFENLCVACPVLGEIPVIDCRNWQQKARTYSNENSMRVRMFKACNRCPKRKDA